MEMPFRSPKATVRAARAPRLPGRIAAVAVVAALPLAAGCAAGKGAQTQKQYQPGVGSDNRDGHVYALNLLVVGDDNGDGTLVGTLINQQDCPDYVIEIQAVDNAGGGIETSPFPPVEEIRTDCPVTAPDAGVALPSQEPAKFPDDAMFQLQADTVVPGTFITLTLRFAQAGELEIDVPVVAESPIYDGVEVSPIEQPTASATTSPSQ